MKSADAKRLATIFAVYRSLPPFEQKQVDQSARAQAERIVASNTPDDRPSLVGVYEAEVSRVKARIWEEIMLREHASKIQVQAEEAPAVVKDPSWPGWPGFIRPEKRMGPPQRQEQGSLVGPTPIASLVPRPQRKDWDHDHEDWEEGRE